ncbi:unnamed protein product [Protopolystoma xenopodis]|uniref:Uncharacterized protein n=1 Tax=Protopolystoma xenopodis TaxID=117903 RepID=A0A448WUG3_9PLAT|nr:unnamed protein product [Protopolystoma xenopodis]
MTHSLYPFCPTADANTYISLCPCAYILPSSSANRRTCIQPSSRLPTQLRNPNALQTTCPIRHMQASSLSTCALSPTGLCIFHSALHHIL